MLDIFIDGALKRAADLDRYFETNERPIGPLHGLPVSFKDQFHVSGMETTMGYVGWVGTFEGTKDNTLARRVESELVRQLVSLGAVPIAKVRAANYCSLSEGSCTEDYCCSDAMGE